MLWLGQSQSNINLLLKSLLKGLQMMTDSKANCNSLTSLPNNAAVSSIKSELMSDGHPGATTMIHTYVTNHQKYLPSRSPLGPYSFSIKSPLIRSDETSVTTLCFQNITVTPQVGHLQSTKLFSPSFCYERGTFGRALHLRHTSGDVSRAKESWLKWLYEHKQLFKPLLFTDNLLTIQLFILRLRQSPSHKQMKSNKALLPTDTEEAEKHRAPSH